MLGAGKETIKDWGGTQQKFCAYIYVMSSSSHYIKSLTNACALKCFKLEENPHDESFFVILHFNHLFQII